MKTDVGKSFFVCLCVLIASSSCFQEHYKAVTTKVKGLLGNNVPRERISSTSEPWQSNGNKVRCSQQCCYSNRLYGFDLKHLVTIVKIIKNNWWIIVVSSLLPFIVLCQIKYNIRQCKSSTDINKFYINLFWIRNIFFRSTSGKSQSSKNNTYSRRPTLPDLNIAKHTCRE